MLFADFSIAQISAYRKLAIQCRNAKVSHLIAGGAPAGMKMVPGDDGCIRTSIKIRIITMHGNKITKPNGMDILELPFNRMRLLKNAKREARWSL